jgi:NAD(P)-dependent dehydrogenase (short-subunit alcohol dehydrogenase family)
MTQKVLILGALSAIAQACARRWAAEGAVLTLAGRNAAALARLAEDLKVRGAGEAYVVAADLADASLGLDVASLAQPMGGVDIVLLAYGTLTDEARAAGDPDYAQAQLDTNFTSQARWCLSAAEVLRRQGHGVLLVIGSVAGDRGRGSNALYGAAKAGLGALVQGLAHRLAGSGARAVLIKPGFTDTPMTAHLSRKGPLWASPDAVAAVIVAAGRRGGPIVYAPGVWRFILLLIRLTPAAILHKTRL